MKQNIKTAGMFMLWVLSWAALVVGTGVAAKVVAKLFQLGWNIF